MKKPEYFDALEKFKAGRYQYSEAHGFLIPMFFTKEFFKVQSKHLT